MSPAMWAGVAVLGGLGSVARLVAEHGVRRQLQVAFPVGTISVNVSGAFLLGLLTGLGVSHTLTTLLGTGFLGAYTTFSGWMLETRSLREENRTRAAAANIGISIALGLLAGAAGYGLGRLL